MTINNFMQRGKASFILGGQYGSEGKGAAAAWVAGMLRDGGKISKIFHVVTTNAGAQAGHTSVHQGVKRIAYHLPTAPLIAPGGMIYINAGAVIDPQSLMAELKEHRQQVGQCRLAIHPMAAVIDESCREAERRHDSMQTKVASTRKGVGEAYARRALRSGMVARDCDALKPFVQRIDLNQRLASGQSVLVEVPQGHSLSLLAGKFYPHCTSRDCTVAQAASDAGIHPSFVGPSMLVLRTYPIRVGNIWEENPNYMGAKNQQAETEIGYSGGCYPDQQETTWEALRQAPEITTVTGRVRRVFSWSQQQVIDAMIAARPEWVFLTHCDYLDSPYVLGELVIKIEAAAAAIKLKRPEIVWANGPATSDAHIYDVSVKLEAVK